MARKPSTKEPKPSAKPTKPPTTSPQRAPQTKPVAPGKTKGLVMPPGVRLEPDEVAPRPKPIGRPRKIDQTVRVEIPDGAKGRTQTRTLTVGDAFVLTLSCGCSVDTAASTVGISKQTVYDWLARGAELEGMEDVPERDAIYLDFADAVSRAREQVVTIALAGILEHAKTDWRAAAWFLERSRPQEYGRSTRVDVGGIGADGSRTTLAELMASAGTDPSTASDLDDPDLA
jgi:hypothetical protein